VTILDRRAALDVPTGRDLPKILPDKSMVLRSCAGSWPVQLPNDANDKEMARQWALVRETHSLLYGPPTGPVPGRRGPSADSVPQESSYDSDAVAAERSLRLSERASSKEEDFEISAMCTSNVAPEPPMSPTMPPKQRDLFELQGEDAYSVNSPDGSSVDTNNEFAEQERILRFQKLLASVRGAPGQLTFSMQPKPGKRFIPGEVRWEGRHHVTTSQHNHGLHILHRDLFERPQPFDMCTKTRKPLQSMPIVARMEQRKALEAAHREAAASGPIEIHAKYPGGGGSGGGASRRDVGSSVSPYGVPRTSTSPLTVPRRVPLALRPGPHTESYLEPLALAREQPGPRALCVLSSLSL